MNRQSSQKTALIGYTGLVGSNLIRQHRFDDLYNSSNIETIAGRHYKLLVCSGVSGTKWLANLDPEKDQAAIDGLLNHLNRVTADEVILISTVDVYGKPWQVDEDSEIDTSLQTPYGAHRHRFEGAILERFPRVHIARLPGIYGWNLRKNALFDLMHHHELEKIHFRSVYQFYWLEHLWRDLEHARNLGIHVLNYATEPLCIQEVAREVFGINLNSEPSITPANYDFRTKHASLFGGPSGYLYDKHTALQEIRAFSAQQRLCAPF